MPTTSGALIKMMIFPFGHSIWLKSKETNPLRQNPSWKILKIHIDLHWHFRYNSLQVQKLVDKKSEGKEYIKLLHDSKET